MELRQVVIVLIKLIGLYLIVETAVTSVAYLPTYLASWGDLPFLYLVAPFLSILIGVAFWLVPARITNTIIKPLDFSMEKTHFYEEIQRIGVFLMGLYLLYISGWNLASHFIRDSKMYELLGNEHERAIQVEVNLYGGIVQLVLALVLVIGAGPISKGARRIWAWGKI